MEFMDSALYLYNSLINPILEYGSVTMSPYNSRYQYKLEFAQHIILRYLGSKIGESRDYLNVYEYPIICGQKSTTVKMESP